jgi:hypothetical protein
MRALAAGLLGLMGLAALPALAGEFFDDFKQTSLDELRATGWVLREGVGHPGAPGSRFAAAQVVPGQGQLILRLATDGTPAGTVQPQLCAPRKFLHGTTSARVRLRDANGASAVRDPLVQSFYLAGPLKFDFDPEFSEVDFEYLPHGGWGSAETRLYGVSWQTVRIDPWLAFNQAAQAPGSHDGWQLFTVQVAAGFTRHFVNGQLLQEAGGRNVPVVPMAISFSHWLAGGAVAGAPRTHEFEIDWVLHVSGESITPAQMQARVERLRRGGVARRDTVPDSGLKSECNL